MRMGVCVREKEGVCEEGCAESCYMVYVYIFFNQSDYDSSGVTTNLKSTRSLVCVCVWGGGSERADM